MSAEEFDKILNGNGFIHGLSIYSSTDLIKKQLKRLCEDYYESRLEAMGICQHEWEKVPRSLSLKCKKCGIYDHP